MWIRSIAVLGLCATLFATPALAEPPFGSYVVTVDGDSVVRLFQGGIGDVYDPTCVGDPPPSGEPICTQSFGYTNAAAQVFASYYEQYGGELRETINFELWGDLRRKSKVTKAKLDVRIGGQRTTDITRWISGGGKVACRDDLSDAWLFTCTGTLEICSSEEYGVEGTDCEKRPYSIAFPEVRAPWTLELDLVTGSGARVSGYARAVLPTENSQVLYLDVVGTYSTKTDTVKLKIGGDYGGRVKMRLSKARFVGDQVIEGRLKYKLTGQSGQFEITAPPPP